MSMEGDWPEAREARANQQLHYSFCMFVESHTTPVPFTGSNPGLLIPDPETFNQGELIAEGSYRVAFPVGLFDQVRFQVGAPFVDESEADSGRGYNAYFGLNGVDLVCIEANNVGIAVYAANEEITPVLTGQDAYDYAQTQLATLEGLARGGKLTPLTEPKT